MLSKTLSGTTTGYSPQLIEVECDSSSGLPGIVIVGLANKAVEESKERVRSAIRNSNLKLPAKRFTLNLAPADVPKNGTGFDLAMAVAILGASGQIDPKMLDRIAFCGELGLDGSIRPINGVLSIVLGLQESGISDVIVSTTNAKEAAMAHKMNILPAETLTDVYRHLISEISLPRQQATRVSQGSQKKSKLLEITGQEQAKRALQIAAAGGHNVLMNGPPGSGKTMLARAMVDLMPLPSFEEIIEITRMHSVAGEHGFSIITERPFRSPHHTTSQAALVGGGRDPQPGEISLSNHGVLFLDELPEYPRSVLESLRQPLEDRVVSISRANSKLEFPAQFILVGTQNPCPCGYLTDTARECKCSASEIQRYSRKISGPLLDRFDMTIEVARIDNSKLLSRQPSFDHSSVVDAVESARKYQLQRFGSPRILNAHMSNSQLKRFATLDEDTKQILDLSARKLSLSARSYIKILKLARTIADLDSRSTIKQSDIVEALQYRQRKQEDLL